MADAIEKFKEWYLRETQELNTAPSIIMAFRQIGENVFKLFNGKPDDEKKQMIAFITVTPATINTEMYQIKENQKQAMRDGVNLLNWYIQDETDTIEYKMTPEGKRIGGRARRRSAKSRSKSRHRK